jgi:hypothetical protein
MSTFKIGAAGAVTKVTDFKAMEFKRHGDDEKAVTNNIKAQIYSSMREPVQRKHDQIMANLDPVGTMNKRLAAEQAALTAAQVATDKYIDDAYAAGVPLSQIAANAGRMAGSFTEISNHTAELAAPSHYARVAQQTVGIPVGSGQTPKRAPRKKTAGKKKGKGK